MLRGHSGFTSTRQPYRFAVIEKQIMSITLPSFATYKLHQGNDKTETTVLLAKSEMYIAGALQYRVVTNG